MQKQVFEEHKYGDGKIKSARYEIQLYIPNSESAF